MKQYTTYRNSNGSYTTYEEDVAPGPDLTPFFIGIIAVYFLLPFSPILSQDLGLKSTRIELNP